MITINNILEAEKYLENIDGVIFDLDDTLYYEKDYVRSGYQAIANAYPEVEDLAEKLWKVFEQGGKAIDVVFEAEEILEEKQNALGIYRNHFPTIRLYQGVSDMLCRLKSQGKKLGIITDGRPEGQRAKIKALDLEKQVDDIIITDELGGVQFRKPNKTAFCKMQEKWQLPFERMIYIGDNPNKDFIAPEKLKMQYIYFANKNGLYI